MEATGVIEKAVKKVQIDYAPRRLQYEIHCGIEKARFSIGVTHRRFGKTVLGINELIRKIMQCKLKSPRGAYIAPHLNQAKEVAWSYLKFYTNDIPNRKVNESELSIVLPGDRKIRIFGADNPDALRGLYFDFVVLDEVAQMKKEIWGEILRPTLVDRQGGALFIGTPKGMNLFSELYFKALDQRDWFTFNYPASMTGIIPSSELEQAQRDMTDAQYRQEYLCDFTASADNTLITLDLVSAAKEQGYHKSIWSKATKIMGVDVARSGGDKSVWTLRQGYQLVEQIEKSGFDTQMVSATTAALLKDWDVDAAFIDIGFNPGVYDELIKWGYGNLVTAVNFGQSATRKDFYANKRAEMYDNARKWMEDGGAIPDDNFTLSRDLVVVTYDYDNKGRMLLTPKKKIKEEYGFSTDYGDSFVLTFAFPVKRRKNEDIHYEAAMTGPRKRGRKTWNPHAR